MNKIQILHTHCSTRYGSNVFDNLIGEKRAPQQANTLLERIKLFTDEQPLDQIICTQNLQKGFNLLDEKINISYFPESFDLLLKKINQKLTWFVAGSDNDDSLIACSVIQSEQGFELYDTDLDACITTESQITPEVPYHFDLSTLCHSREQNWLLALLGASHLLTSPVFRCQRVGCK